MVSLRKRTILVLGMAFSLIVIMIYGSHKVEMLPELVNNALSLDSRIKSDSAVNLKRNLVEETVTLTLGLPKSVKPSSFFEQFVHLVKEQSKSKIEIAPRFFYQNTYVEQFVRSVKEQSRGGGEMQPRLVSQDISGQLLTGVIAGDIDIALMELSGIGTIIPEFSFLQSPGLFHNVAEVNKIWNSEVGDYLRSKAFEKGLTILAFEPSGFSHFFTSQPIVDFQQIQNSTVGIPLRYYDPSSWQKLNINTLILEPEQMLSAVEDGAIQAYSTTMEQIAESPIKQPLKFLSKTNLSLTGQFIVINQQILSTLPKSLQTVLIKSVENSVTKNKSTESKQEVMVALEKKGVKRYDFPEKVQSKLKQLAQRQIELNRELWGNYLIEMTFQLLHKDQPINDNQILIGLDADLTSSSSQSGVAIKRGIELALDEINQAGGVLGKELVLKSLSHTGFSDQGIRNIKKFAKEKNLVAIVGGLHSPVALAEQEIIHQEKIVYLDPWAAATAIVDNGYSPNYTFRLSVRDQYAAPFLVAKALKRGYKKIAYLYEDTGWGRGNLNGIISALKQQTNDDITLVAALSFVWGEDDFNHQLAIIEAKGAEVILLVANAPEGVNIFKNMALRKSTIPVISHWGITGGNLDDSAREALKKLDIKVLQTFSLMDSNTEKVTAFKKRYFERYPTAGAHKILSESGTVHAYELIYLLVKAIEQAQSIDRVKVRDSLERIENYSGLIKTYHRPFTALNHDALGLDDLNLRIFRSE